MPHKSHSLPAKKTSAQKKRRLIKTGIRLALAIAILTLGIKQETFRAHATGSPSMKLVLADGTSTSGTFYVGRCFESLVKVNTDGMNAGGADSYINFNSTYVSPYLNNTCTTAASVSQGAQIDTLFDSVAGNTISGGNQIRISQYVSPSGTPVNTSNGTIAHLWWKVIAANPSYSLAFQFTAGSTIDTNLPEWNGNGSDPLASVTNLTLDLEDDSTSPAFSGLSPAASATNVSITPSTSPGVYFTFTDNGAGISQNGGSTVTTLSAKISGTTKSLTYSNCSTSDSNRTTSCKATLASVGTLSYLTWYNIAATGSDVASPTTNSASTAWWFQTEDDTDAPWVTGQSPASAATGVSTGSNIVLHIKDYKGQSTSNPAGLGVAISSVQVTVSWTGGTSTTYTYSGAHTFSPNCTSPAYDCTITISGNNFPQYKQINVSVDATDSHAPSANVMTTTNYSFTTADSGAPTFSSLSPAQSATSVAPDSNVVMHILDTDAGVDLNNTTITVAGTAYTAAGANQYGYTCTSGNKDCTFTVNPASNFTGGQSVTVSVSTRDQAATPNTATTSYSFTVRNLCTTCSVDTESPARFSTGAALTNTISFHVKDSGTGIKKSSIAITLTGTGQAITSSPWSLTPSSAEVSIIGDAVYDDDYTVTITLPNPIETNRLYGIQIAANDNDSVPMATVAYTFGKISASVTNITNVTYNSCASSSACACTTAATGGGGNPYRTGLVESFTSAQIPVIVARRVLPNNQTVNEELAPEVAQKVSRCYVDQQEAMHAAAEAAKDKGYMDVPAGAWFEKAVNDFAERGILDKSIRLFRPTASASRAEFAKMLTGLNGKEPAALRDRPIFDDVDREQWYAKFIENAGDKGWMKGYGECAGSHPCLAKPGSTITRAEAVAMIVRYYGLAPTNLAPKISDVPSDAWYYFEITAAADRCIIQSSIKNTVRPGSPVSRAELIVMLDRAERQLQYGRDCVTKADNLSSAGSSAPPPPASELPSPFSSPTLTIAPAASSVISSRSSTVSSEEKVSSIPESLSSEQVSPTPKSSSAQFSSINPDLHPSPVQSKNDTRGFIMATITLTGFLIAVIISRFIV